MNKPQIWEILQTCLLASEGRDIDYLIRRGFNPKLAIMGLRLFQYLANKKIEVADEV